jgi:ABC-type multidrug transport system fused ATPase/permease subunit
MRRPLIFIIGGASVAVVLAIGIIVWFTIAGWWPTVVDIVLVFTALVSAVMLLALVIAIFYLTRTVLQVKDEIMPVLDSLRSTSTAVRETAKTTGAFGVSPAVRTASFLAGAGEVATVVLGRGRVRKRAEKRQKRRQEIELELAAKGDLDGNR